LSGEGQQRSPKALAITDGALQAERRCKSAPSFPVIAEHGKLRLDQGQKSWNGASRPDCSSDARRLKADLFPGHLTNHRRQAVDIFDNKIASPTFNDANARKTIEFAGNSLAVRAGATGNLGMGWRIADKSDLALSACRPGETQDFGTKYRSSACVTSGSDRNIS
jgi:hypothetical protein